MTCHNHSINSQAIVAQHQAQVLLRHSWQSLLHCCCGLQHFIRDIVDLLPAQVWADAACKQVCEVLQPLQSVCLHGRECAGQQQVTVVQSSKDCSLSAVLFDRQAIGSNV